jgi:Flp pilus assembly protein TadG
MALRRKNERGASLVEFSIGATVFMTAVFGAIEFGRLLWTHNALSDAARRGARYAVNQPEASKTAVKNLVVYGDANGGTKPMVNELKPENVLVDYSNYGLGKGTVQVSITGYKFTFVVPVLGKTIEMPDYHTTLTGENVGFIPPNV